MLAVAAVAAYLVLSGGNSERALASQYVNAWARNDYSRMYTLLSPASRRHLSRRRFEREYRGAAATATMTGLRLIRVESPGARYVPVRVAVSTRLFGTLTETLQVFVATAASDPDVQFGPALLFPGLRAGEQLSRRSSLGRRGTILADDGTPLAEGPSRTSPLSGVASEIVGTLGPIPSASAGHYRAIGYPANAQVGQDGLELIFQKQLAGRPGRGSWADIVCWPRSRCATVGRSGRRSIPRWRRPQSPRWAVTTRE